jgi:hypothetical protein
MRDAGFLHLPTKFYQYSIHKSLTKLNERAAETWKINPCRRDGFDCRSWPLGRYTAQRRQDCLVVPGRLLLGNPVVTRE